MSAYIGQLQGANKDLSREIQDLKQSNKELSSEVEERRS